MTLSITIKENVRTIGTMERFSIVDRRLFQRVESDRISEALSNAMRHIRLTTLRSEIPIVAKVWSTGAVLKAQGTLIVVALTVILTVLNIDDIIQHSSIYDFMT